MGNTNPPFPPFSKVIVLASKSPRRAQLLRDAGFNFRIHQMDVNEDFSSEMPVSEVAAYLADKKATAADLGIINKNEILLTADSVVVINNQILNKPGSKEDAYEMLQLLSDQTHIVYTGVCLRNMDKKVVFSNQTNVTFGTLSDHEIHYYIDQFNPMDKAGSYGIQEWIGLIAVERIEGSYFTVMGLPTHLVWQQLVAGGHISL
jgi:septum formation protein